MANLPPYTPAGTTAPNAGGPAPLAVAAGSVPTNLNDGSPVASIYTTAAFYTLTVPFTGSAQGGTSTPVITAQPTIVCNYIVRII